MSRTNLYRDDEKVQRVLRAPGHPGGKKYIAGKVQQTVHVQGYTLTSSSTCGKSYSMKSKGTKEKETDHGERDQQGTAQTHVMRSRARGT